MIKKITQPTLIVNESICRNNIRKMAAKAKRNNVVFRPHFKTHQSAAIGEWFADEGIKSITVSSVQMATYFANNGWEDITIAFPVNLLEIQNIDQLAARIQLTLIIDQQDSADFLNKNLTNHVNIMIKVDTGYHRAGIDATDINKLQQLIKAIDNGNRTAFTGFLAHAGHSYDCRSIDELKKVHEQSKSQMLQLKDEFIKAYPKLTLSVGDTPTCSTMEDFSWADEIRPGNFIFYDLSQVTIGSCNMEDIAVALACPVVGVYSTENKVIIYGGGVHFSKEIHPEDPAHYGRIVSWNNKEWSITEPATYITKISQEHGIIKANNEFINNIKIEDLIFALPIHSCMTANLMNRYLTCDGKLLLKA